MKTYYVIWRDDGDQFMITALDLEPTHFENLNNNQLVEMCWDVEWGTLEEQTENPFVGEDPAPYDLIDVVTGTNIEFVGRV